MKRYTPEDYESLYLSEMDSSVVRVLMGGCIAPRPIALITTLGPGAVVNAAPYANFMGVASVPPLVAFALGLRGDVEKDTLLNIRDHGVFVVNATSVDMAEATHHTAADYPRDVSEIGPAGLSTLPGEATGVPRIAESPIHIECRLYQLVEIGGPHPTNVIVIGEALRMHARRDLVLDGPTLDAVAWRPLGGIGDDYMHPGATFALPAPLPKDGDRSAPRKPDHGR